MGKNNSHVAQAMRPKYGRMDGGKATHKHTHTPLNDIYTQIMLKITLLTRPRWVSLLCRSH